MVSVTSWFVSNQPAQSRQALKQPTSKEKYFLPTVYTEKSQDAWTQEGLGVEKMRRRQQETLREFPWWGAQRYPGFADTDRGGGDSDRSGDALWRALFPRNSGDTPDSFPTNLPSCRRGLSTQLCFLVRGNRKVELQWLSSNVGSGYRPSAEPLSTFCEHRWR